MISNFIPEGVEDLNYEQYERITAIENSILNVFRASGFRQIKTPTFEYFDLFDDEGTAVSTEDMYKIVDNGGHLMVLKPDATIPIARMVATHYKEASGEIKLMYNTNVYRSMDFRAGGKREFRQAGIEYFGVSSYENDAEIISIAIRALKETGFHDLKTELGNAEYFNGLLDALAVEGIRDAETQETLRTMVEAKRIPAIDQFCEEKNLSARSRLVLRELPFLYGSVEEVAAKAADLALNDRMKNAVDSIVRIAAALGGESVSADMGIVSRLEYYSGMIFRIYLRNSGVMVGSGGRYDSLMTRFGKHIPAAGFGLNIDLLYEADQAETGDPEVLNIALGKGRLADLTMERLAEVGIVFPDYSKKSRKLIFEDSTGKYRIIFVKAVDVGIYVEKGACDVGVIGRDTLLESASDVFEIIDLQYGKCIFAVAAPKGFRYDRKKKLRVATKYPRVAKDYFAQYGRSIEIIKINGSVELAPLVGLSDVIVDIVETGNTLRENGLEVVEPITDISARFIVNRASMKTKENPVSELMNLLKERK